MAEFAVPLRKALNPGLQGKGLQSSTTSSATASLLIKKLSVHEGRKKAFLFSWPRKAETLLKPAEIGKHKSFGERPRVGGCSENGCVAHLVHPMSHEHY